MHHRCITGASRSQRYIGLEVFAAAGAYEALGQKINCMDSRTDGVFRWMTVAIGDDQVQKLELFSDFLQRDTLLLYWGAPDAIAKSGDDLYMDLYWERGTYSAKASVLEHDSMVKVVTLTAIE